MDLADKTAGGRVVSVLEGGYDLQGLKESVTAHVGALMGADHRHIAPAKLCFPRPLVEAGDDIRFLQTLQARSRDVRARVSGTITHWERELATGAPLDQGPVADVLVTVRGESSAFHATTDERGHYEVTVPPGRYDVTASPAAPFSAPRSTTRDRTARCASLHRRRFRRQLQRTDHRERSTRIG